jgi:protein-tyrosine phosphatase
VNDDVRVNRDRVVMVDGSHNVRDLGGFVTTDGSTLRRGRIFRSDYPAFVDADPSGMQRLELRAVVDLRRTTEADFECVDWERRGVACHRVSLSAGAVDSWHARYPSYLTQRPEAVVEAVRLVIDPANHPVLFHCAAGKDRTGVVAALVLALLGVSRSEIVADYLLTERTLERVLARLAAAEPYAAVLGPSAYVEQRPRAEYLHALLDHVDRAGGAESWLLAHGLTVDEVAEARASLLTTGSGFTHR